MTCGHAIDHPGAFARPKFGPTLSIRQPLPLYSAVWSGRGPRPLILTIRSSGPLQLEINSHFFVGTFFAPQVVKPRKG